MSYFKNIGTQESINKALFYQDSIQYIAKLKRWDESNIAEYFEAFNEFNPIHFAYEYLSEHTNYDDVRYFGWMVWGIGSRLLEGGTSSHLMASYVERYMSFFSETQIEKLHKHMFDYYLSQK